MSFERIEKNGVVFFRSTLLPCPHAFTTRLGGVSAEAHLASLNLGNNRGDDPANVIENFRRIFEAAGLPEDFVSARQIHSKTVLFTRETLDGQPELDGFCTDARGLTLCVKVADCIPILLCDKDAGVIAALHAGWRGTAAGIAAEGVRKMVEVGAKPENVVAAIGAGIGSCCFEVKEDFVAEFTALAGKETARDFISSREGRFYADLKGANVKVLANAGVKREHIDVCPLCTCCDPDLFFSHRASGGKRGTMAALIAL